MRDPRHTHRSVLSLDRAQLVGLAFFAVLSGGLMFGLGYSAGKIHKPEESKALPPVLSQIDAEHALHEKIKQDQVDYTFFKALVDKDEVQKAKKADTNTVVAKLDPVVEVAKSEIAKSETAKAETPKPEAAKALPDQAFKEAAKAEAAPAKDSTFASTLSAPEPAIVAPKAQPKAPVLAKAGEFTIQVSAFKSENEADGYVHRLQQKGFQAFITPATVTGKGTWYRVRVGHFNTQASAEVYKQKLEHDSVPAWIVKAD